MIDCLVHDKRHWKIRKLVGNIDLYIRVEDVIKRYFKELKEVFICAVSHEGTADFRRNPFFKFLEKAGVTDKRVITTGIVDTYFKASNFEENDQENNDDNALNRFEFIEMLVRIAKYKYVD